MNIKIACALSVFAFGALFFNSSQSLAASDEEMVKRGAYLVNTIGTCANCHSPKGGPLKGTLAGGNQFGGPKAPFTAFSANLTSDKETGIGARSDAEIILAIREGVRHDGTFAGPPMPTELYRHLSDNDAMAMVAYLRTLKPVRNKVQKSVWRMPTRRGLPAGKVADVPKNDLVKYGEYLAGPVGHCMECHTPQIRGKFDFENQLGAGGREFRGPWGVSVSSNITPTGLKNYTSPQIIKMITEGVRPDGSKMKGPMGYGYYANMESKDLDSLVAYLRSLPEK